MTFRQLAYHNVVRNRRNYAAFFLASVFSVMVFFVYSMFIFHPTFEEDGLRLLAIRGMLIAEVVLYIFTLFFLFYSMSAFLQARSKEFGVLMQLGMTKKQLNKLIFFEMLIIGTISTATGIAFGFAFSKFFLMIGREIMELESLPLYVSWQPFLLTIAAFASLFVIISFVSVGFIRTKRVVDLLQGFWKVEEETKSSTVLSIMGIVFLAIAYTFAASVSDQTVYLMIFIVPPLATFGTYLFFTHTIHSLLRLYKRKKNVYWKKTRLVSLAEASVKLKDSAQMFFIVTIVSTVAFLTVGTLASFMSYTGDFRESNPLGLVYISFNGNEQEAAHIDRLTSQLESEQLSYDLVELTVKRQTSGASGNDVDILSLSEFNRLAIALDFEPAQLQEGEGMFVPFSLDSLKELKSTSVETVLFESNVPLSIQSSYPHVVFPIHTLNVNTIIVSDADYEAIDQPLLGYSTGMSDFTYYAFDIQNWTETINIGNRLTNTVSEAVETADFNNVNFFFENPGDDYRWFKSSFALLLFIGVMVAAVFLLAAGSFIYFKLYTGLERDRKQYKLLVRLGMTDKELGKIVNRQLIPQFFLPWTLALLHSAFAFVSLQVVWEEFAELSILGEMALVLGGFTIAQILYFFLIRWRYVDHLQAP
ncbi:ABC transporter permease [Planococcus antarcticus DSM 14505]|uniref:ABC transporter permease n=1 Tax=Planococcus antarcticus DSM 14505 TaxID=1185653 RepID=A0A1C7DJ55_9BACL|nr:ABC transporter permease [Planococcus antarcticus]ANU11619.1 ABC transporter permease [Planococcus antarcticus DSM 14505]EIM05457.1 ABC transporter permease [Planococcus antarcticus DSM 14505]